MSNNQATAGKKTVKPFTFVNEAQEPQGQQLSTTFKKLRLRRAMKNPTLLENYFEFEMGQQSLIKSVEKYEESNVVSGGSSSMSQLGTTTTACENGGGEKELSDTHEEWNGMLPLVDVEEINEEWERMCNDQHVDDSIGQQLPKP